jgi:hypothetical protein
MREVASANEPASDGVAAPKLWCMTPARARPGRGASFGGCAPDVIHDLQAVLMWSGEGAVASFVEPRFNFS